MTDIAGRTALVTGGASGIGLATARALAKRGARPILADLDLARAQEAAREISRLGVDAMALRLDVTDEDSWARAGEAAIRFGAVSLLISNAGVGGGAGKFEVYDPEVWRWNYAVNAHAHLYACRTFLPAMKAQGQGHITLTSSMVALAPPPISVAYISSKAATLGIAMGLRNELQGTGVGVSVLCPGMSATRIVETTRELRPGEKETGAALETSRAMDGVLAGGMDPAAIGERVAQAIAAGEFWIFTHPEWKRLVEPQVVEMLAAFGAPADPAYRGDDIDALLNAQGAARMNAVVDR